MEKNSKMNVSRRSFNIGVGSAAAALVTSATCPELAASSYALPIDSKDFAEIRDVKFLNVPDFSIEDGPFGHIGVDLNMGPKTKKGFHKDDKGKRITYNPCKNTNDSDFGACQLKGYHSFFMFRDGKIFHFPVGRDGKRPKKGVQTKHGIFWENEYTDAKGKKTNHNWANKITGLFFEIYPRDEDGRFKDKYNEFGEGKYGGCRFSVSKFSNFSNGGVYSPHIGKIVLPSKEKKHAKLNGFVWHKLKSGKLEKIKSEYALGIEMFQWTGQKKTNRGYAYSSVAFVNSNKDGYYQSGPVHPGRYKIYITDNTYNKDKKRPERQYIGYHDIKRPFERLDWIIEDGKAPRLKK